MLCKICKEDVKILGRHLNSAHKYMSHKDYYDRFLKTDALDGICPTCGKPTKFLGLTRGYRAHCSTRCSTLDKDVADKRHRTNLERYGVEETFQSENNKRKAKETKRRLYGDENYVNSEQTKRTNLERYGVENPFSSKNIQEKIKKTTLEKYGVEHISQNDEIKRRSKETKLKRYGDESYVNKDKGFATKEERYGDPYYNNSEKREATTLERYGDSSMFRTEHFKTKSKQTMLDRYGVEHFSKTDSYKERMKEINDARTDDEKSEILRKIIATNLERYGVENCMQSEEIRQKAINTNMERYGVKYAMQSDEIKKKTIDTNIRKYGVVSTLCAPEIKDKANRTKAEKLDRFQEENNLVKASDLYDKYGTGWYQSGEFDIIKYNGVAFVNRDSVSSIEKYRKEHTNRSNYEKEILNYIRTFYDGKILTNKRNIIPPQEIDIYLPDLKIGIECDGCFYHSTNHGLPKNYHLQKTIKCSENDIRLIHIVDIEWNLYTDKYKGFLKDVILGASKKIYARECEFKGITQKEADEFLREYHLQNSVNSRYRYALIVDKEIIAVATFGIPRFNTEYDLELLRLCFKTGYRIVGGFSKLLKKSLDDIKKYQTVNCLVSYVDISKFNGESYIKVGFKHVKDTVPSYSYYKGNLSKLSRYQAQKHLLPNILGDKFDINKTEVENMVGAGWLQVFDCGNYEMRYDCEDK